MAEGWLKNGMSDLHYLSQEGGAQRLHLGFTEDLPGASKVLFPLLTITSSSYLPFRIM